jgi:glycosyltransferase involved in cell wall biosynthesis
MCSLPKYVLITPARNEAAFIEQTIESVVAQTVRPAKWVIVSDGSTDWTDEIVKRYASHEWIELVRMPERRERHFTGKVHAFNAGYARLEGLEYQAIGSLDADISFGEDYFSFLLGKLAEDPALGVVGTPFEDGFNRTYNYRFMGIEHVSGACQLFRRKCFEEIGGYVPVKDGGVDHIAVMTARMKGWKTRTFIDRVCVHHREMGTAQHGVMAARFRAGLKDYAYGSHPVWELLRVAYQTTRRPFLAGGLALGAGYLWALARRAERPIPPQMVAFRRREQMERLRNLFTGRLFVRWLCEPNCRVRAGGKVAAPRKVTQGYGRARLGASPQVTEPEGPQHRG